MDAARHHEQVLDQFTRQADPFLKRHAGSGDALLALMAGCAALPPESTLLDVACGPGIVSCFFANRVRHVTGLDTVPAMLERARHFQQEKQLTNLDWVHGQSDALPFADASFDCVVSRFALHHFLDPLAALREMKRVCRRGGTVLIADVTPPAETQKKFNLWEVLRDPSHTRALTAGEMRALGDEAGLQLHREEQFAMPMQLETLLGGSFPRPGDADRIRVLFEEDIRSGIDSLGVAARLQENAIWLTYPVLVLAWNRE
ncbi:MAG TPA: methyltransferase domain-containing protein [Terracidiphilus sp.]|nr:methyltransferase domain-containing protein [Terracidiphilus sp.]